VAARLAARLLVYVEAQRLGVVLAAETGFTLFRAPDTVRAPDVACTSNGAVVPLTEGDAREGEDVVPGFRCPVAGLLR
jgi:hypothetical protein